MFGLFLNDVFINFWSNKIGDEFIVNTCTNLSLNMADVDLVHYSGIKDVPEWCDFDANKNLIILKRVMTPVVTTVTNEDGSTTDHTTETESFEVEKTIAPVVFVDKGLALKDC